MNEVRLLSTILPFTKINYECEKLTNFSEYEILFAKEQKVFGFLEEHCNYNSHCSPYYYTDPISKKKNRAIECIMLREAGITPVLLKGVALLSTVYKHIHHKKKNE